MLGYRLWRSTCASLVAVPARWCHSDLFKLYGRHAPAPSAAAAVASPLRKEEDSAAALDIDDGAATGNIALRELARFRTEVYVCDGDVSPMTRERTLRAVEEALSYPATRRSSENDALWMDALRVLGQDVLTASNGRGDMVGGSAGLPLGTSSLSFGSVASCCAVLILSEQHHHAATLATSVLRHVSNSLPHPEKLLTAEYSALLRIATSHVISHIRGETAVAVGDEQITSLSTLFLRLLAPSRRFASCVQDKDDKRNFIACVELFYMALDWLFYEQDKTARLAGSREGTGSNSSSTLFVDAKEFAPPWLREALFVEESLFTADRLSVEEGALDVLTPALVHRKCHSAVARHDRGELLRLFSAVRKKETSHTDWHLFTLSKLLGECLLRLPGGATTPHAQSVVEYLGTTLDPVVLGDLGNSKQPQQAELAVQHLSRMRGTEAYAALKKSLFHHPPEQLAQVQMQRGDVMLGDGHSNWQKALEVTQELMGLGESTAWRRELPTTLRLLSDAGKYKEFFRLASEYSPHVDGGKDNLVVAASLAQAMRRTGRWQFHLDVVDLIAAAPVPQSRADDLYLEDAALQALYALRNAKRWEEAAQLYGLLKAVMPPTALRLFASAVSEAVANGGSNAAETARELLRLSDLSLDDLPMEFADTVKLFLEAPGTLVTLDLATVPATSREHVRRGCVSLGIWPPLLALAVANYQSPHVGGTTPGDGGGSRLRSYNEGDWIGFLKGVAHCKEDDPLSWDTVVGHLPVEAWQSERCLLHIFHAALWNGWLRELQSSLEGRQTPSNPGACDARETEQTVGSTGDPISSPTLREATAPSQDPRGEVAACVSFMLSGRVAATTAVPVRHSLVGHYYTSFMTGTAYTVPIDRRLQRRGGPGIAKHFRVPPLCIGQTKAEGKANAKKAAPLYALRPYPTERGIGPQHVYVKTDNFVIAYKPAGAVIQSAARGVLSLLRIGDATFHLGFLLPPSAEGLFLLIKTTCNPKRILFDVLLGLTLMPLSANPVALLSTKFFRRFSMSVEDVALATGTCHVRATCRDLTALGASDVIRAVKEAANEEGWTIAERDADSGDAFIVYAIAYKDLGTGEAVTVSAAPQCRVAADSSAEVDGDPFLQP